MVVVHGVQDAPLDGLEPVAHVRERPRRDDRQGVVQISLPSGLGERDGGQGRIGQQRAGTILAFPRHVKNYTKEDFIIDSLKN